jgi:tRNA uridine 5-carbamoylmethylation protein Kti12
MEAVLFIGVQGSGKTTFYEQRFSASHTQVSGDALKTRKRQRVLIDECLAARQPFVVDNTNFLRSGRADIIARAKAAGVSRDRLLFPVRTSGRVRAQQPARRQGHSARCGGGDVQEVRASTSLRGF